MASNTDKRTVEIIMNGKKAEASMKEMKAAAAVLNKQLEKMPTNTKEFADKSKELKKVRTRLGEVSKEARSNNQNMSMMAKAQPQIFSMAKAGWAAVAAGIGLAASELQRIIAEYAKLNRVTQRYSELQGDALHQATGQAKALADTFDADVNEVLRASNTLAKTYGMTFQDSLEMIKKGYLQGADASGDFLSKINEYTPVMKQANIQAEDFVKLMVQEEKGTIFDDKLIDAVKTFAEQIRELTPAAKAALAPLGDAFNEDVIQRINSGKESMIDIFQDIIRKAREMGLNAQQTQTLIADLGGGPLEDLGGLENAFNNIDAAMKSNLDTLDDLGEKQKEQVDYAEKINTEYARLSANTKDLVEGTKNFFNVVLAESLSLLNRIIESYDTLDERIAKNLKNIKDATTEDLPQMISDSEKELTKLVKKQEDLNSLIDGGPGAMSDASYESLLRKLRETTLQVDTLKQKLVDLRAEEALRAKQANDAEWAADRDKQLEAQRLAEEKAKQEAAADERIAAEEAKEVNTEEVYDQNLELIGIEEQLAAKSIDLEVQKQNLINILRDQTLDKHKKRMAAQKAYDQMMFDNIMTGTNLIANSLSSVAEYIDEYSKFGKAVAVAEIFAQQGSAIANATAGAIKAAKDKGPAFPYVVGAYIATGISAAITGIGQALKAVNKSKPPEAPKYNSGGGATVSGGTTYAAGGATFYDQGRWSPIRSAGTFAGGGHVGSAHYGIIGERGAEWVAPNWMVDSPSYGPIIGMLEMIRANKFAAGGSTQAATPPPLDTSMFEKQTMLLGAVVQELQTQREQPKYAKIIWTNDDTTNSREEVEKQETIENFVKI
ncbi:phage tail tape measure protein [Limibacter armeniacum]|uniref:phage tail tape measure protein n=1 Tax=Limibacter armeniacum TaxID=466084 RepID=UPI002FE575EF